MLWFSTKKNPTDSVTRLPFDLVPFTKRESPPESQIYTHLTSDFRYKLRILLLRYARDDDLQEALIEIEPEYAREFKGFSDSVDIRDGFAEFVQEEDDEIVLDYLEYLVNIFWSSDHDKKSLLKFDSKLRRIFLEERILIILRPDHDELERYSGPRNHYGIDHYYPPVQGPLTFDVVGDETIIEADSDIRALGRQPNWQTELRPYNVAWEQYQAGNFTSDIFEHLNKAIENTVYRICKKDNSWVDDGAGLGECLNELQEHGFFEPNNELYGEWSNLTKGLKIGIRKPDSDKHRHEEIKRDYVQLVLHQVAAFLVFLITRYEDEY